jgi:hypothetical protein
LLLCAMARLYTRASWLRVEAIHSERTANGDHWTSATSQDDWFGMKRGGVYGLSRSMMRSPVLLASTTSRPAGEIEAAPISSSTAMETFWSNVGLSKADAGPAVAAIVVVDNVQLVAARAAVACASTRVGPSAFSRRTFPRAPLTSCPTSRPGCHNFEFGFTSAITVAAAAAATPIKDTTELPPLRSVAFCSQQHPNPYPATLVHAPCLSPSASSRRPSVWSTSREFLCYPLRAEGLVLIDW